MTKNYSNQPQIPTSIWRLDNIFFNKNVQFIYHLKNVSMTLCLVDYLANCPYISDSVITVISQIDGWVVSIKMKSPIDAQQEENIKAVLNELGEVYSPSKLINSVLMKLESGATMTDVMFRYQVPIVSHGLPKREEIEIFRHDTICGLGYCPQYLT